MSPPSYSFAFNVMENILAVYLFSIATGLCTSKFEKLSHAFMRVFRVRRAEEDAQLDQLNAKIVDIKSQMSQLSPTADFAKYFKCERSLKKLEEEFAKIETNLTARTLISSMKLRVVFAALLIVLSLFLAWHSNQDFVYISLDKKWLYPLCYLMRLGAFTASIDDSTQKVTMFEFLLMAVAVKKIYEYRSRPSDIY